MVEGKTMDLEVCIGSHRVRLELPDVFVFVGNGDFSGEDIRHIHEEIGAFEKDRDYFFILIDASLIGTISTEARQQGARSKVAKRARGVGIWGATFAKRVVFMLMAKAFAALNRGVDMPIAVVATEAEARAWVSERRKVVLAEKSR